MKSDLSTLTDIILQFRNERDWAKYHDAKNIAISLSVEASELLELFLWRNPNEVDRNRAKDELADVFYSAILLAHTMKFDIKSIVEAKLVKNKKKYPVSRSKGSNKKYNQL